MKKEKLYYIDSHIQRFTATVVECRENNGKYEIILDKTAFFPEGGGQSGDTGYIADARIFDTQIVSDTIIHYSDTPLTVNSEVEGRLDWLERFSKMQNHSGEHIVSGLVHSLFGYDNVGFHMSDDVTIDFDGELSKSELQKVETLANEAIYKNVAFRCEFPYENQLKTLDYRSKLELTEDVRIVTIEGYDCCACCAPHVNTSGEIGIIKILDSNRHRGGMRVHLLCGARALEDYRAKCRSLSPIAEELCVKPNDTAEAFSKYKQEHGELKMKIAALHKEILALKSSEIEATDEKILIFEESIDMNEPRKLALEGAKKTSAFCAAFCGSDNSGYRFAIAAQEFDLRALLKQLTAELNAKGGGSNELIQGNIASSKCEIENFFNKIN